MYPCFMLITSTTCIFAFLKVIRSFVFTSRSSKIFCFEACVRPLAGFISSKQMAYHAVLHLGYSNIKTTFRISKSRIYYATYKREFNTPILSFATFTPDKVSTLEVSDSQSSASCQETRHCRCVYRMLKTKLWHHRRGREND